MSIRPLFKVTLIGMLEEKVHALDALQSLGLLHIVPLASRPPEKPPEDLGVTPEQLRLALQYLVSYPDKRRQVTTERHFDLVEVVHRVLEKRRRRLKLEEQRDALVKRIRDLEPWGSFALPGEQGLYGQRLWFYLVPNYRMKEVEKTDLVWSVVHRDNRHTYVAVIAEQEPRTNQMPVPRTHTGSIPLAQLQHQLQDIEIELELLDGEREADTRWIYLLQRSLAGNADAAERVLPAIAKRLVESGVELRGCAETRALLPDVDVSAATEEDWHAEYLDLTLAIRIVPDLEAALEHIATYGSSHTEAIVTEDPAAADAFVSAIQSSTVLVNASTRFADGGELGLGAEIGISTDKFHARGPCGLRELTTYKYVVHGSGQVK